jgi:hypothetical protein
MATTEQLYKRWLDFNIYGQGKLDGSSSSHRYYKSVYYFNEHPQQRIIHRRGNKPVILMINQLVYMPKAFRDLVETIYVEDLSVFSKYPDDMLDAVKAHERQRFIMLSAMLNFVDIEVPKYSDENCFSTPHTKTRAVEFLKKRIKLYSEYSKLFDLDWPPPPPNLQERLETTIQAKAARWAEPKNAEKRERARARRLADKALGLS